MITIDLIEKTAVELQKLSGLRYFHSRDDGWQPDWSDQDHFAVAQQRAARCSALAREWLDTLHGAQAYGSWTSDRNALMKQIG